MVVEFSFRKSPSYRVASITRTGPWRKDNLRAEFRELTKWAKHHGLRSGRWIFLEPGDSRWTACLEIWGKARSEGRIRLRTLPAATVASVVFDPDAVSPQVIYHGLNDWLKWRRKDGKIKRVLSTREVYSADPWTNPRAWAHAEVQFVVRK